MSEETKTIQPELPAVEPATGEKHSAVIARGINLPAHQVRLAIKQAVVRGQVGEEDGEGFSLEELNSADDHFRDVTKMENANADSLAFLDQMNAV